MHEETIFGLAGMAFAIILIALFVVSFTKIWQTKIKTAKEEIYQRLAADAVDAQKESARLNDKLSTELTEIKERLASIERILKEVE